MIGALAAAFAIGLVNPTPVPAADAAALGSTMQRYHLTWHGEASLTRPLVTAPDTTPVLSVDYDTVDAPAFCAWLDSILDAHRFPYVIVGNEPPRGQRLAYVAILRACAPVVHAHGARVVGPGLHPAGPVSYLWPIIDAIALGCRGCLDVLDFHPYWYSGYAYDAAIVQHARAAFGWKIPVWISEDGLQSQPAPPFTYLYSGVENAQFVPTEAGQASYLPGIVKAARCSGVSAWFNLLLEDEPQLSRWQSGIERPGGSHKPAFDTLARAARDRSPCPPPTSWPPTPRRWPVSMPHQGQTGRVH